MLIYESEHATAELTTESSASSYNIPVLRIRLKTTEEEQDLGPGDFLPSGLTARDLVRAVRPSLEGEAALAADRFLGNATPKPCLIDSDKYGEPTPFESVAEAQRTLRELFPAQITLRARGNEIVDQDGEVVGHLKN